MKQTERLDTASSIFFLLGFVVSQLQHTPYVVLATLLSISSLCFYTLGYGLWLLASQFYLSYPKQQNKWYGFSKVKTQHQLAASIGFIAMMNYILGVFSPQTLIFANWLFFLSNSIWLISEYHKKQNPPMHQAYSLTQQNAYLRYAMITTIVTFVPALGSTLSLCFKSTAWLTLMASNSLDKCLGLVIICGWLDYGLTKHKRS